MQEEYEKIGYKDLNGHLKFIVVAMWIIIVINVLAFLVGFVTELAVVA